MVFRLTIGVTICLPKLLRPVRIEKQGYREAAKWLRENAAPMDIIAVPANRIAFYAERKGLVFDEKVPEGTKYIVRIVKDENELIDLGRVQKKYSAWVSQNKKEEIFNTPSYSIQSWIPLSFLALTKTPLTVSFFSKSAVFDQLTFSHTSYCGKAIKGTK